MSRNVDMIIEQREKLVEKQVDYLLGHRQVLVDIMERMSDQFCPRSFGLKGEFKGHKCMNSIDTCLKCWDHCFNLTENQKKGDDKNE